MVQRSRELDGTEEGLCVFIIGSTAIVADRILGDESIVID